MGSLISFVVGVLGVLITCIATLIAIFAYAEWKTLAKKLKKDLLENMKKHKEDIYRSSNAAHKVLSSYNVTNVNQKIALLLDALTIQPEVYNGYNALGYAYLEKKDHAQAIEAFTKAIYYHSKDPAGYCDLAYVYLLLENLEACKRN